MGEPRDLIKRINIAWNGHDQAGWGAAFSAEAEMTAPGANGTGPEAVRMFYAL
jgi:hypothetical protein